MMVATPEDTLDALVAVFPGFALQWASEDNYNTFDDGSFDFSGVWAEFSIWFLNGETEISTGQYSKLASMVNACFTAENESQRGSVAVCFLENIAGNRRTHVLKPDLAARARVFLEQYEPRS